MENLVLDIQRASVYDGPGIRTTVFLKGCPLKCAWCHNPESQSYKKQLSFNNSLCVNCGACVRVCRNKAHYIEGGIHKVNFEKCNLCGACVEACNRKALFILGKKMSSDEIVDIIVKDKVFYDTSNGGVTISGGEALSNIEFTLEILKKCKEKGIHTCVETSGYTSINNLDKVIDYIDLFLFDFKVSNKEKHLKYTGVSNENILKNLNYIYEKGKNIILRCPIIPGVNDDEEHFEAIKNIVIKYKDLQEVELLPYHDLGISKGKNIGAKISKFQIPSKEEKVKWIEYFESKNIKKVKIS